MFSQWERWERLLPKLSPSFSCAEFSVITLIVLKSTPAMTLGTAVFYKVIRQ